MDPEPIGSELSEIQMVGFPHLQDRRQLLQDALHEEHPGKILDESKSFLESVFRTITIDVSGELARGEIERLHMPELCQRASDATRLSVDNIVHARIAETCRELVHMIAQLRNSNGASSHGRDGQHVNSVGLRESVFVARTAISMGMLFLEQHRGREDRHRNGRLQYLDNPEFNAYLDEQEDVEVAGVNRIPSEVLFHTDIRGYRDRLNEFVGQGENIEHD